MKKLLLTLVVLLFISLVPVSSVELSDLHMAYGKWILTGDRLFQQDIKAGMARIDIPAPQAGMMVYEFNIRYEDGGTDDMHAGFGIHIFVDKPSAGRAWGNGKSYLLWLNYDENAKNITKGLSAQIYKSINHSRMDLVADIDLNEYTYLLTEDLLDMIIPIKIVVNGFNGDVKIYDPSDSSYVYKFNLGTSAPLSGQFVSLRTNSMGISFGR